MSNVYQNSELGAGETLKQLQRMLIKRTPFFYQRFGDADLYFMEDPWFNLNRRHQPKTRKFGQELMEAFVINDPRYLIAVALNFHDWHKDKNRELADIVGKFHRHKQFWNAIALHTVFLKDFPRFKKFLRAFRNKKVCLIGGETICRSSVVLKAFNIQECVEFPDTNAYDVLNSKMAKTVEVILRNEVTISALGQATRILGKRLWNIGVKEIQYFDVGSVVDALAGAETRTWIEKNQKLIEEQRKPWL